MIKFCSNYKTSRATLVKSYFGALVRRALKTCRATDERHFNKMSIDFKMLIVFVGHWLVMYRSDCVAMVW